MKTLAIGLAAALGLAWPASADTVSTRVQLAQAKQDSGTQSGGGAATTQQSGGSATTRGTAGTQSREGAARSGETAQSGTAGTARHRVNRSAM